MSKHTPGPWRTCEPGSNFHKGRLFVRRSDSEALIATVASELKFSERAANARLIAAAPELLQALKALREVAIDAYKAGRVDALAFITAGNVIAKAEGR